jgi:hypothetical protein
MLQFLPALLLFLAGWLIKYKKATWLISGYNIASRREKERYDVEKLTRLMGNFVFLLAGLFFIFAAASVLFPAYSGRITSAGIVAFLVVSVAGLVYLNTGKRLLKDEEIRNRS